MKKLILALFSLAFIATIFTACNKDKEDVTEEVLAITTSEDLATTENLAMDVEDLVETTVDDVAATRNGGDPNDPNGAGCPTVTVENPWGVFPNTITIDFGEDGCEGPGGHIRKGKIIVVISDTLPNAGASRTVSFEDFSIDDIQLEGSKTKTFLGTNNGIPCFERKRKIKITYPDGTFAKWNSQHTACLIEGADTKIRLDDVRAITGSSSGINRNGKTYEAEITVPLIKKRICPWIVKGVRKITVNGFTRTLDYGFPNEGCDRLAVVTFPSGKTKVIKIHHWWNL